MCLPGLKQAVFTRPESIVYPMGKFESKQGGVDTFNADRS